MISTMPVSAKIKTVSLTLTSKILPKRKLKMSMLNPPDRLIITKPAAIPDESKIAIDASPEIFTLSFIFVMINALASDIPYAVHNGYTPDSNPNAIPPNEV